MSDVQPCGSSYRRGCRCESCNEEHTERARQDRAARARRPASEVPHGPSGYKNWGCRCDVCKAAGAVVNANRKPRRKASAR